jgi:hypothetical protein
MCGILFTIIDLYQQMVDKIARPYSSYDCPHISDLINNELEENNKILLSVSFSRMNDFIRSFNREKTPENEQIVKIMISIVYILQELNKKKTFEHCANLLTDLISVPFQIAICAYLLYNYIGISALIGLSTMALFIPSNICFVYLGRKIRFKKHKLQDSRIKMMIEILNGIRVIKFYGWEVSVKNIIENLRMKEITNLIKSSLLSAFTSFTWNSAPIIVACSSFATYLFINRQVYFLNFTKKIFFYNLF